MSSFVADAYPEHSTITIYEYSHPTWQSSRDFRVDPLSCIESDASMLVSRMDLGLSGR